MPKELDGQVAIITGAGTGIGRAIARRFAEEGAALVVVGRRATPLEKTREEIEGLKSGSCSLVIGDVSKEADVKHVFEETLRLKGRLDVLVNNAGIAGEIGPIWDLSVPGWNETVGTNLTGPWLCMRAAARIMRKQQSGKIVSIGSISGKRPLATRTPYTATKMGLVGLTRTVAVELGEYGINVNMISPGLTDTPRIATMAKGWSMTTDEVKEKFSSATALRRIVEPNDIAECTLFLTSDRSKNITGFDITIDCGLWFS